MPEDPYALDALAIRRAFSRAARSFDSAAALQPEVRARLLERLTLIRGAPDSILELGSGTGHAARALKKRFASAQVLAVDFAFPMQQAAASQQGWVRKFTRVCADASQLPLRTESVDWCISNLMLAWCEPIDTVLREVRRVLKPGGVFAFSSLGPDTLTELRSAWSSVDSGAHVHRFIDMHDVGDALVRAGFAEPVLDVERIVLTFGDPKKLLNELKATGFATATQGRVRHLGTRQMLRALVNAYDPLRVNGKWPATFEIVYGQAWCAAKRESKNSSAEIAVPIARIGRRTHSL